jgi:hypothetical protein
MANTFTSAATGSRTDLLTLYTCPVSTTAVVHAIYLSNVDGTNDATVNVAVSGSATFNERRYLLKTVDVAADSTVVVEKPINLGAGDKLETQASANGDIDVFASILEMT